MRMDGLVQAGPLPITCTICWISTTGFTFAETRTQVNGRLSQKMKQSHSFRPSAKNLAVKSAVAIRNQDLVLDAKTSVYTLVYAH